MPLNLLKKQLKFEKFAIFSIYVAGWEAVDENSRRDGKWGVNFGILLTYKWEAFAMMLTLLYLDDENNLHKFLLMNSCYF